MNALLKVTFAINPKPRPEPHRQVASSEVGHGDETEPNFEPAATERLETSKDYTVAAASGPSPSRRRVRHCAIKQVCRIFWCEFCFGVHKSI